jgi:sulfite reductase beta subunit-like hemoprotein
MSEVLEQEQIELAYDEVARRDIESFREAADDFIAGRINVDEFRAVRLRRGVYSQRQADVHMIRTKVPGGNVTSNQMRQLAAIADEFAGGIGHLTTRQNIQYHFVPLARVSDLLHRLADVRLTSREACYNTVRNVTACPLSGLLPDEPFDVQPYARQVAFAFLHQELTDSMPRKFKIAFSGCPEDCMATHIHDIGLRATIRDGKRGFRVVAAGGLGPLPSEANLLDDFLPAERLINRVEAALRVFNAYGNRANKNKARFKFIVRERGWDWVKEQIDKEYADILANGGIPTPETVPDGFGGFQCVPPPLGTGESLPVIGSDFHDAEYQRWLETNVRGQKQQGYAVVTVRVSQGNLTGNQMRGLAYLADNTGDHLLRLSMDQNVMLGFIPVRRLKEVYSALRLLHLEEARAHEIDDVVTCPGAYSCNLGLTKTMNLGAALSKALKGYDDPAIRGLKVRASGCPNGCGQHWIGDIGFYGNARKIGGKEVPYYQMLLGGAFDQSGIMRFGLAVQSLPARLIPTAVQRVLAHFVANRVDGEAFREYVLRYKIETFRTLTADLAKPAELEPEMYCDWGDEKEFSLSLGRGECAA